MEINQSFYNLDIDKQKRIIEAALKEFAENGYEKASTNQIVKNAGIGKGMLFYYFNSKEDLYLFLINYCLDITMVEFFQRIDTNEPDFVERLKQIAEVKAKYHLKNPYVLNFLGSFILNEALEVPKAYRKRYEELLALSNLKLYENIDKTLFRKDVDTDKALKLIQWSIEGYQNELINQLKNQNLSTINFDPYWAEFYGYLEVLKTVYYQKEEGAK
ncbi:TetR/AcrR family transcriptional regulator [Ornithinibacillus bavariensis]|uniref:TetR family transcriptional regulator n=1 Tax=Ornithinibacillus bavariensis TaxID=545502 RepID=A0A919X964_9BACI|nr:TetR/AcrR family transcriptional regulator [Ornithinibacillus bavariensis]GIO27344.1 TetR family transcriptional regulator [Ornithinibacillus bavariensis]